jgi:hypothetical protein
LEFLLILLPAAALAQGFGPIVSTDDLAKNLKEAGIIIVDVRKVEN